MALYKERQKLQRKFNKMFHSAIDKLEEDTFLSGRFSFKQINSEYGRKTKILGIAIECKDSVTGLCSTRYMSYDNSVTDSYILILVINDFISDCICLERRNQYGYE